MNKIKMSKDAGEFCERFKNFSTFYSYQQKHFREEAEKAEKKNDLMASNVLNGKADVVAEIAGHAKTLLADLENLIKTERL